jgi:hypothetical protein
MTLQDLKECFYFGALLRNASENGEVTGFEMGRKEYFLLK